MTNNFSKIVADWISSSDGIDFFDVVIAEEENSSKRERSRDDAVIDYATTRWGLLIRSEETKDPTKKNREHGG